jgi:hypothetical protein
MLAASPSLVADAPVAESTTFVVRFQGLSCGSCRKTLVVEVAELLPLRLRARLAGPADATFFDPRLVPPDLGADAVALLRGDLRLHDDQPRVSLHGIVADVEVDGPAQRANAGRSRVFEQIEIRGRSRPAGLRGALERLNRAE